MRESLDSLEERVVVDELVGRAVGLGAVTAVLAVGSAGGKLPAEEDEEALDELVDSTGVLGAAERHAGSR